MYTFNSCTVTYAGEGSLRHSREAANGTFWDHSIAHLWLTASLSLGPIGRRSSETLFSDALMTSASSFILPFARHAQSPLVRLASKSLHLAPPVMTVTLAQFFFVGQTGERIKKPLWYMTFSTLPLS